MLLLDRDVGERIIITVPPSSDERIIEIELVRLKSKHGVMTGQAVIGFVAPRDVAILRAELA